MPTKKKTSASSKSGKKTAKAKEAAKPSPADRYEEALGDFAAALELLHGGSYDEATGKFEEILGLLPEETGLADRARAYIAVCRRKTAPPPEDPRTTDDLYYTGVMLANDGRLEDAMASLNRALEADPESATILYARAMIWAKSKKTEEAISDLRKALMIDPLLRFQLANDSDFEKIRDEAAFIDIIEPTPSGA